MSHQFNIKLSDDEIEDLKAIADSMSNFAGKKVTIAAVIRYAISKLEATYWK